VHDTFSTRTTRTTRSNYAHTHTHVESERLIVRGVERRVVDGLRLRLLAVGSHAANLDLFTGRVSTRRLCTRLGQGLALT
jgi:hypothetical protein